MAFAALILSGCNSDDTKPPTSGGAAATSAGENQPTSAGATPTTTGTASAAGNFKIALVETGSKSDNGWNAEGVKALETVQKEFNLAPDNVKSVENQTSPQDQENSMKDFAAKKFNIVFCHGAEYQSIALKIEKDFPNTLFVISSGEKAGHNTLPIILKLEDGAYLEGMLAAGMSKTGKIGAVGAEKIAPLERIFKAYEMGAKSINPKITVVPATYTEDWADAGKAKQQTLALLNQGCDVIIQDLDTAAQGVFNAVQEYDKGGKTAYALGTNSDQNGVAPDVILASAPIYSEKAWVQIVKEAQAGTLKPSEKPYGMKEGVVDFIFNPKFDTKIPADLKTKIEGTKKKIADGSFDVSKGTP